MLTKYEYGILLDQGLSVILQGADKNMEWVFSHGHIVNLFLNKEFISEPPSGGLQHVDMTRRLQVMKKGDGIMIGQPPERYLPRQTRVALKTFYKAQESAGQ